MNDQRVLPDRTEYLSEIGGRYIRDAARTYLEHLRENTIPNCFLRIPIGQKALDGADLARCAAGMRHGR